MFRKLADFSKSSLRLQRISQYITNITTLNWQNHFGSG